MIKIRTQGDLFEYLNQQLQLEAERAREAKEFDSDDEDYDEDYDNDDYDDSAWNSCDECGCGKAGTDQQDAKLSQVIQTFVNKCAQLEKFPSLQEAQTLVLLHSVIK